MLDDYFFVDRVKNISINYSRLFFDLQKIKEYTSFCQLDDFYQVFNQIILSILLDKEIILIDADFSEEEKINLLNNLNEQKISFESFKEISLEKIKQKLKTNKNWRLTLFTSGTTGRPKGITHNKSTLLDNVRIAYNKKDDIWGYAYSVTHMAGIQVFFQALLNGNTIVKLFGYNRKQIIESIQKDGVTHISATPTFFRLLLPNESSFTNVKRITFGGEKLSNSLKKNMVDVFPKAKFLNVYASTEAGAIFAAEGDVFEIKKGMQSFVMVKDSILFIHKCKVGESEELVLEEEWYNTGDLVEVLKEDPMTIRFLSRKNEMLNVGGYKVNPYEVEDILRSLKAVQDVRVFGKTNSVLGNIICADIVLHDGHNLTKQEIVSLLKGKIQDFKIPRVVKILDSLEKTRTGKIKRS